MMKSPELICAAGVIAVAVAAGARHTCALRGDARVTCWGDNTYGQLGATSNASTVLGQMGTNMTSLYMMTGGCKYGVRMDSVLQLLISFSSSSCGDLRPCAREA